MNLMQFSKKCAHRIIRILSGKKGVYGKIGVKNRFVGKVFIHEMSTIGNYKYFGSGTQCTRAVVGNYCSIAPSVKIGQAQHSVDYITTYNAISEKNINHNMFAAPSIIGNDVWIGANAVIMQGVKIGDGAVIGANTVVTKDVPDYAVAVGVPAKVLRYRFSPEKIKIIKETHWWDNNIRRARKIISELEGKIYEDTAYKQ